MTLPTEIDREELLGRWQIARQLARQAGDATRQHFLQADLQVDRKSDDSPVTAADREAEQLIRSRIAAEFPADGIVGEELGTTKGSSAYCWVIDPIDGTKSFISGVPLYATLVGILHDDVSVAGVIYLPVLDEMVHAATGEGCWYTRSGRPAERASVSARRTLAESLLVTTEVRSFAEHRGPAGREAYERLEAAARLTRTWGDAYGYLLVATGRAEVMIDPVMNLWDAAALLPILEEAGGTFTDWRGQPTVHSGEGIATNGHVLAETLSTIRGS